MSFEISNSVQSIYVNEYSESNESVSSKEVITFIDLFAGLGGTRIGFEQACKELNLNCECVFTSEIKSHAVKVYTDNFPDSKVSGDITAINPAFIPDFDYLLAGFPCQPFSSAGKRHGFLDERGGLFFTIHKILAYKQPLGFLLENVDGLVTHDNGKTLDTIISSLENLGYNVSWAILDSSDFNVPQKRKRVYITGHKYKKTNMDSFSKSKTCAKFCIEHSVPGISTPFIEKLLNKYTPAELHGKSIKDKRGGGNNIHSWDICLKGEVTTEQKKLLELILKKRRNKKWADAKGIDWMDGMPLTFAEIQTFYNHPDLEANLNYLTKMGYLKFEYPKMKITVNGIIKREYKTDAEKGYNIVSGKLSFPLTKIIDPNDVAPTIVATEAGKIGVATENGVRPITVREGLRFSGFPDNYKMSGCDYFKAFDLLGNTVMPPVIKAITIRLIG